MYTKYKIIFILKISIILERDSGQRNMSIWERSGCSNTSISSMLQNSIYQVASSRMLLKYQLPWNIFICVYFFS